VGAIRRALELGITYFDTAPAYGDGESEGIFGEALADAGDSIFLATKAGTWVDDVRDGVRGSLDRLRRRRIDLLQIHGSSYTNEQADAILGAGGMLEQMEKLREEGLVRFVGFTSEDNNAAVYRFIESGRFDTMQIAYNLMFQHPYEPSRPFGSMPEAKKQGMAVCTMRTATSGILQKWIRMVNPADHFDYTPALIRFVLSNPLVDVALVGMRTGDEVERNVRICDDLAGRVDLRQLHERYV
jgi:aryl-alcohol dehydrogenase-like predicted oxidoreductase